MSDSNSNDGEIKVDQVDSGELNKPKNAFDINDQNELDYDDEEENEVKRLLFFCCLNIQQ